MLHENRLMTRVIGAELYEGCSWYYVIVVYIFAVIPYSIMGGVVFLGKKFFLCEKFFALLIPPTLTLFDPPR